MKRAQHVAMVVSVILLVSSSSYAQFVLPPVIISAAADATMLTIHGSNFGSSGTPKVTLNSTELFVQTSNATDIVAFLPPNLPPASYLLVIYRAPNHVLFGVFVVTIGGQGPKGDKGDKGDPCLSTDPACVGPKGDKGDKGDPGPPGTGGTFSAASCTRVNSAFVALDQFFTHIGATCPANTIAVSGGYSAGNWNTINTCIPISSERSGTTGWTVEWAAANTSVCAGHSALTFVLCCP